MPLSLVFVALVAARPAARRAPPSQAVAPAASASATPPDDPPRAAWVGPSDVTFAVASDTHVGYAPSAPANAAIVSRVATLEGARWPLPGRALVAKPRGLVLTGDLTEWGKADEWAAFVHAFGLDPRDPRASAAGVPLYEMVGNHDKVHGPWVEEQVKRRHGGRFYSWDWEGVHLVALGEAPDAEGIDFLARDLSRVSREAPIVLFFHLALEGPWSRGDWFDDGPYKGALARIVSTRRVAAIFHGHHHARGRYMFHGVDVVKPGAAKNGDRTMVVARVTDARLEVAWLDLATGAFVGAFARALPKAPAGVREEAPR